MDKNQLLDNVVLELKRGVTTLAVLMFLQEEQYGYSLQSNMAEKGIQIEQGTLYPLLRRLESQGLLTSIWRMEESRPRRYYMISPEGKEILPYLITEWDRLVQTMTELKSN